MRKVILFGTGKVYRLFMKAYDKTKLEVIGIVDNDVSKQGTILDSFKILSPDMIEGLAADWIIITASRVEEIKMQLQQIGIKEDVIKDFYSVFRQLPHIEEDIWDVALKSESHIAILMQKNAEYEKQIKELQQKSLFLEAKNFIHSMPDTIDSLEEVEFQVFSQFGEDGIIQWLIKKTEIPNKVFVEFGVEDYMESNSRFLLMNNNWSGLVIEGNGVDADKIRSWELLWKYDLTIVNEFITKDNINHIIENAGISGDIGLLSVDIDGNDYWVLCAIDCIKPRILICEYNNTFGLKKVTIPYEETFYRTDKHYSNLYWGASLGAFLDYAERNGYYYFGSNSAGNNAFFVRKDCIDARLIPKYGSRFVSAKYRESRDTNGNLTYISGEKKLEIMKDMKLINLETGKAEKISDIYCI